MRAASPRAWHAPPPGGGGPVPHARSAYARRPGPTCEPPACTCVVQDELRDGGALSLAALQARAYGLSGAGTAMAAWKRQLRDAAPAAGVGGALGHWQVAVAAEGGDGDSADR
jgi:hypothetical protein